ncbi:hypothetical protein AX14_011395 [Amanita brunnescens Koide BX004]|nr:hypothetical protein AX14_011395 [Amanita brunnescens Koide BX004]
MSFSTRSLDAASHGQSPYRLSNAAFASGGDIRPIIAPQSLPGARSALGTTNQVHTLPLHVLIPSTTLSSAPTALRNTGRQPGSALFTRPVSTQRSSPHSNSKDSTGLEKPAATDLAFLGMPDSTMRSCPNTDSKKMRDFTSPSVCFIAPFTSPEPPRRRT